MPPPAKSWSGDGAGALTFEELVRESGFTRGGITYHFPTKEDLLRELLEADFLKWDESEAALTPGDCDPETARLLGFIRTLTATGRVPPPLPLRDAVGRYPRPAADGSLPEGTARTARPQAVDGPGPSPAPLHLAAEGLMWQEMFQMYSMPGPARTRLVALMEALARQWGTGQSPNKIAKEA